MPNWVYQSLTVEGNPESVIELKKQLNTPFTKSHDEWDMNTQSMKVVEYTYDNPIFAFWNVIRPTDMDAYVKQPDHSRPFEERVLFSGNDWYSWNVRNWGTKWDVAVSNDEKYPDTEILDEEHNGDNLVLVYKFQTAWSPAIPVLIKLSEQYPDLLLTFEYQEETGWGGEIEFLRGKINSESEYDEKCNECGSIEASDYCDECNCSVCSACGYNYNEVECPHLTEVE